MSDVTVQLEKRSYPIHIQAGLLSQPGFFEPYLSGPLVVIVTNDTVANLYLSQAIKACGSGRQVEVITVPDGEAYKTLEQYSTIMTRLLELNASRDTTLVALGGGVIGDLCGFVAATYQRGVPFIQVPTTLLAQVDSSVGGKTAVNHPLGKNMIGAFYQPQAVIIDTDTLKTLPPREFAAGMAEVIKYGIIYDDSFFKFLQTHQNEIRALQQTVISDTIKRCCEIKAEVVAADEREANIRAILNLGHTFGHAIEAEQGYGSWLHGEAVAAGMVFACQSAEALGWLKASETQQVIALLEKFDLPVTGPASMNKDDYVKHMKRDKKVSAGKVRFVLPKSLGHAIVTSEVTDDILTSVLGA